MKKVVFFLLLTGFHIGTVSIQGNNQAQAKPPTIQKNLISGVNVEFRWGVKIPMRDGINLNATIYKPENMETPLPVIFILTPYIADREHQRALYFARNGYVFVAIDSRGRGNSEGKFAGNGSGEGRDGYDVVEWLARQSWSNGKVAMYGHSYRGMNQWFTLKEFPPHLQVITPVASWIPGMTGPLFNNINSLYTLQFLTETSGVTLNRAIESDSTFWSAKYREIYLKHLPYKELDKVSGNLFTAFQEQTNHPTFDAYWEGQLPMAEQYQRMNLPILTITGYYDQDQPGAMHYYRMHMQYGSKEGRDKHYLIIGPWDHSGTWTPRRLVGGVDFGQESLLNMNKLHQEWYDWTLKGGKKPEFLRKRVAYYVAGANEWKYADSLESIQTGKQILYLNSGDRQANDVFHSGLLSLQKPQQSMPDKYTYDPLDVRPAELEGEDVENYLTDQRYALNLFQSGLVYHSEPFTEETEITGNLRFVAWIGMDVPDTDFQVSVYEILPDGTSIFLTEDRMRARYRESLKQEKLNKTGEINKYEFNAFPFFSRRIAKGSRLRLVLKSPNSIYWEKNYNSGGVVAEESGKDARTAHITLYHDREHFSLLEIPIAGK